VGTNYRGSQREIRALDAYLKLKRATSSVTGGLQNRLDRAESLTESQFGVLDALYHLGALSPGQLSAKLFRSSSNLTTVIANLERDGLVRRTRDPNDGRAHVVSLTTRGRRLIQRLIPTHVERVARAMSALSPHEQEELGRLCRKLGRALSDGDGAARRG
jgi:MarR family transcriptional regulator, 2-MHQ and catechol-resistance regulon repressor